MLIHAPCKICLKQGCGEQDDCPSYQAWKLVRSWNLKKKYKNNRKKSDLQGVMESMKGRRK